MPGLCNPCSTMFTADGLERLYSRTGYRLHGTIADLKVLAAQGCPLCCMLTDENYAHSSWGYRKPYDRILKERPDGAVCLRGAADTSSAELQQLTLSVGLTPEEPNHRRGGFRAPVPRGLVSKLRDIQIRARQPPQRITWENFMTLQVSVRSGTSSRIGELQTMQLGSPLAMDRAKEWISTCFDSHDKCRVALEKDLPLPSRVLDVGSGIEHLRLVETNREPARYVALSYCWGGEQSSITLQSNLAQHLERINTEDLSPSIRDAVEVTAKLGFSYLWTDALCIVQDSAEDKICEINKMDEYYKNASVTLVAAAAKAAKDGFLDPDMFKFCEAPIELLSGQEAVATITHSIRVEEEDPDDEGGWTQGTQEEVDIKMVIPISTRGWTLQEKLLSPRKLRFGVNQLDWHCSSGSASYSMMSPETSIGSVLTTAEAPEKDPPEFDFFAPAGYQPRRATLLRSWWSIVADYTSRQLGVAGDKLPAISAIAKEFQRPSGDTYVAGMWRSRLLTDLTWEASAKDWDDHSDEPTHTRSPTYRAPSWSWASLDGKITMGFSQGRFVPVAEICDINIELESHEAPFSKVKAAWMEIEAPLKELPPSQDGELQFKSRLPTEEDLEMGDFHDEFKFDLKSERKCEDGQLGCLYLWRHTIDPDDPDLEDFRDMPDIAGGLIIARSVFYKEYRRVGKFMAPVSWFEDVPRTWVRLV